jgi:hypothetical protein
METPPLLPVAERLTLAKGHGSKFGRRRNWPSSRCSRTATSKLKWMKLPEFDASYREARRIAFRQSVACASGAGFSCSPSPHFVTDPERLSLRAAQRYAKFDP